MGETIEGSSGAAQGAQIIQTDKAGPGADQRARSEAGSDTGSDAGSGAGSDAGSDADRPGLFRRLIGALGRTNGHEVAVPENPAAAAAAQHPGMLNLRRLAVEDVMVPKAEIVAAPSTITKDELVKLFRKSGLTRIPVYEDTLDHPIGMIHLKDFALSHGFNGGPRGRFALKKMLRPLLFVPPSMPIGVLLAKMQAERRHLALVIDEFGGVDGLVTIEDLIEQVVGEIEDEHDQDEDQHFTKTGAREWMAQARTPLDEFEAAIGRSLTAHEDVDEEDIDTLGGLVFMLAGRVPVRGEVIRHPDGTEFEVIDADPRRIKRLRVRLPKDEHG